VSDCPKTDILIRHKINKFFIPNKLTSFDMKIARQQSLDILIGDGRKMEITFEATEIGNESNRTI
jgi:hypothetical protein